MQVGSDVEFSFVRLDEVAPESIVAHMSDARLRAHMPLLTSGWNLKACHDFIAAKEAYWQRDGLGHWAILHAGAYVGWGGFQKEDGEWDYGLVLKPEHFGLGARITRQALAMARADARIPFVTFLLPPTRRHLGGLARLGAVQVGEISYEGERFLKFRLETPGPYSAASPASGLE